jgi:DNA-binding CsgD family transcriptional regulator
MRYLFEVGEESDEVDSLTEQDGNAIAVAEEDVNSCEELEAEASLTSRQRDVLNAYRQCGSIMKAAMQLGIGYGTTREHMSCICAKLGVTSVKQLNPARGDESESKINEAGLMALLESQEFRCALTGQYLTPDEATLDHKIPISKGGEHSLDNVWWVNADANTAKGTMDVDQFVTLCRRVASWTG